MRIRRIKKKVDLLNQAGTATDELRKKAEEAAKAQQEQFIGLKEILGELSVGIDGDENTSLLDLGISEDFTKSVQEGLDKTAEKLNESIANAGIFEEQIRNPYR